MSGSDTENDSGTDEDVIDKEAEPKVDLKSVSKNIPKEIEVEDQVFSLAFHVMKDVIAAGEITGSITLHEYSVEATKKLISFSSHKKACRDLFFSFDGTKLFSCSKDKSIHVTDLNTGALQRDISQAHGKAVNCLEPLGEHYFASGSDNGTVKVWDVRTCSSIMEFDDNKDYISDMVADKERKHLLCTSGDGLLSVFNTRKKKLEAISDQQDEEMLSVVLMKDGKKVACGTGDGTINIFSWGEWGDISDRIPTQAASIDVLCALSEDIICTGADDSYIRSLFIQPHQAIGVLGKHGTLGIQSLKLSHNKNFMASTAGESTIKFWNLGELEGNVTLGQASKQNKSSRKRKFDPGLNDADGFFDDL